MQNDKTTDQITSSLKIEKRINFLPPKNPKNAFRNSFNDLPPTLTSSPKLPVKTSGLFDPMIVKGLVHWEKTQRVGPGFFNLGNSCFLNSTLQCLLYTAPLSQILLNNKIQLFKPNQSGNQSHFILQHYQR
jgi:ubiquitin C-terminal hydrolase